MNKFKYIYCLKRFSNTNNKWQSVTGAVGGKNYIQGWFDALISFYPCPAYRIENQLGDVIETHPGSSQVTAN